MQFIGAAVIGGNDTVTNNTTLQSSVLGGSGIDTVNGGSGRDCFNGGADNDTLNGNGGNDTLIGNTGVDVANGSLLHAEWVNTEPRRQKAMLLLLRLVPNRVISRMWASTLDRYALSQDG